MKVMELKEGGSAFSIGKVALMMLDKEGRMGTTLRDSNLTKAPDKDTPSGFVAVVHLASRKEMDVNGSLSIDERTIMTAKEEETLDLLRARLKEAGYKLGARRVEHSKEAPKEKELGDELYKDRLKKSKEEAQREELAASMANVSHVKKKEPDHTKSDIAVLQARSGCFKQIDEHLVALESTRELLGRIGLSQEMMASIDKGMEGFAQYRRLRERAKRRPLR